MSIGPAVRTVNDHAGYPQDEGANALVQEPYSSPFFALSHPKPLC